MIAMNVVLLGAPGIGKGTAARLLSERLGLLHVSTGDVLRQNIRENTELGVQAGDFVDSGMLVPDEIVTQIVKSHLSRHKNEKGYLLDGYPRTIAQATALESFSSISHVLNFSASKKTAVERIAGRRTCPECNKVYHLKHVPPGKENACDDCGTELYQRSDETPSVIVDRLRVYEEETMPLVDFYRNKGILAEIDASPPIQAVLEQCVEALER